MNKVLAAVIAIALTSNGAAAADERTVLEPHLQWVMNYDEDSCALQREFGEEGQRVFLDLRKFGPRDDIQILVSSGDFSIPRSDFGIVFEPIDTRVTVGESRFNVELNDGSKGRLLTYDFSKSEADYIAAYREFVTTTPVLYDDQRRVLLDSLELDSDSEALRRLSRTDDYQAASRRAERAFRQTPAYADYFLNRETSADGIFLIAAFDQPIFLHTGRLNSAMDAMRACLDELVAHWGVDVEAHRTLTREVEPYDYNRLVREMMEDYPRSMVRQRIPAILRVRLEVSAEGAPTACHFQSGINDPSFEQIACDNLMRFGRFVPALDAAAQPIASYFQLVIVYRLP